MTEEEKNRCRIIIHTASTMAGVGNAVPVPGLGFMSDTAAMSTMAISLAAVFGKELTSAAARGMAYTAIKRTILAQPKKFATKEVAKVIPWIGTAISSAISLALTEAAGWQLAQELDMERCCRYAALPAGQAMVQ